VRMCGHHYQRVQINRLAIFPKTTLENQLASLTRKFPPLKCPECYKNWTIVFEDVWKRSPVGVFAIKVHLIRLPELKTWRSDAAHSTFGWFRKMVWQGGLGLCGGGALPR